MSLLWLPAASPLFMYSPSSLVAENLQGTWAGTIPGGQPSGAGIHSATSLQQSGAVLLPSIYSSGFSPVFSPQTGWNVSLIVNSGTPQAWAPGQAWTGSTIDPNTFLLQFECNTGDCSSSAITFGGGTISTQYAPAGRQAEEAHLDDAEPGPTYTGDFAEVDTASQGTVVAVSAEDQGGTLSWTGTPGASVSVTFQGTAIAAYGVVGPSLGPFGITLDGNRVSTLSARFDVEVHNVPLYFGTLLDPSVQHTLTLEALDGGSGRPAGLAIDRWQAWGPTGQTGFRGVSGSVGTPGSTTPSSTPNVPPAGPLTNGTATPPPPGPAVDNSGPNTGAIVGGVIGGLAGLGLLYFMFRKVHKALKPDDKKVNPWDEANMLQNVKNEGVHVTTVANQRYVYPGMIAHSKLKG